MTGLAERVKLSHNWDLLTRKLTDTVWMEKVRQELRKRGLPENTFHRVLLVMGEVKVYIVPYSLIVVKDTRLMGFAHAFAGVVPINMVTHRIMVFSGAFLKWAPVEVVLISLTHELLHHADIWDHNVLNGIMRTLAEIDGDFRASLEAFRKYKPTEEWEYLRRGEAVSVEDLEDPDVIEDIMKKYPPIPLPPPPKPPITYRVPVKLIEVFYMVCPVCGRRVLPEYWEKHKGVCPRT